jgi:hypothetical protein
MSHEHLYKTARIRTDIGFTDIQDMLPGELVAVKYWKHAFDKTSDMYRPVYYIAKSQNFKRHFEEGTFATVYDCLLERFVL